MATKLGLYNAALHEIGNRKLASLAEDVESRRVLDTHYDAVLAECLEAGLWNFATRALRIEADGDVTPAFGHAHVFAKPSDWVRTAAVSASEDFDPPLLDYADEAGVWSADVTPIYVRYISNATSTGLDLALWPRSFARLVELELAHRICRRLTQSESQRMAIERDRDKARRAALNRDAMNEATARFAPTGSWTLARGRKTGRDRGRRGSLTE